MTSQPVVTHEHVLLPPSVLNRRNPHYLHFWVDDFIPPHHDLQLRAEYPTELLQSRIGDRLSTNLDFHDQSKEVSEFLSKSPAWCAYYAAFSSPQWLTTTVELFKSEFVRRYPSMIRPFLSRRVLNVDNLEVTVALSYSRRGFLLSPHSDDKFKVLTLIHYLPEDVGAETTGGTRFFLPKPQVRRNALRQFSEWSRSLRRFLPLFWLVPTTEMSLTRRYTEGDAPDHTQRAKFDESFLQGDYVEYRTNRMSGFVKNDWTIHELDLSGFPNGQYRRAALVNVRLRPTVWSRVFPATEALLSYIKHRLTRLR